MPKLIFVHLSEKTASSACNRFATQSASFTPLFHVPSAGACSTERSLRCLAHSLQGLQADIVTLVCKRDGGGGFETVEDSGLLPSTTDASVTSKAMSICALTCKSLQPLLPYAVQFQVRYMHDFKFSSSEDPI